MDFFIFWMYYQLENDIGPKYAGNTGPDLTLDMDESSGGVQDGTARSNGQLQPGLRVVRHLTVRTAVHLLE